MRRRLLVDGRIFSLQADGDESLLWGQILGHAALRSRYDITIALYPASRDNRHTAGIVRHVRPGFRVVDMPVSPDTDPSFRAEEFASQRIDAVRAVSPAPDLVLNTHWGASLAGPESRQIVADFGGGASFLPEAARSAQDELRQASLMTTAVVVCSSQTVRSSFLAKTGDQFASRAAVIYPGHEPAPSARRENSIVFAGPRDASSRFDLVVEAAAAVLPHGDWQLSVLGGGPAGETPDAAVDRLGTAIEYQPAPDSSELVRRLATARAYLSASESDACGLALLQALASGTVAILSDTAAHRELAGARARYFAPGDAAGAAMLLRDAMTSISPPPPRIVSRPWSDVVAEYISLIDREAGRHAS